MSLDRSGKRSISVGHKRPNAGPHRRFVGHLRPIGHIHSLGEAVELADLILHRVQSNRQHTVAGSYLLAEPSGEVYVLAEASGTTRKLVANHMAWYVASYAIGNKPAMPELEHIVDDLVAHFADLGMVL